MFKGEPAQADIFDFSDPGGSMSEGHEDILLG